ncbi:MAG: ribonuclease R [Nitrospiraceae bacterium]|nr:ribonuclease R [Nitrospiraceae bacterium]
MEKKDILSYFSRRPRPQSFRELSAALGANRQEARMLKRLLAEMLDTGELVLTRKGLYAPSEEINLVRGYFEAHADFGFVISDLPGQRDLFIPPYALMGARDNDRVIARPEAEGGRKGRIIRILERAQRRVAGRVEKSRTSCFVKPRGKAFRSDIYIAPEDSARLKNGQSVIVEITDLPSDKRPPEGKVIKVLAAPEKARDEVEAIMEEYGLPARFPRLVAEEARKIHAGMPAEEEGGGARKDLTRLPTVTIDGERARDFDDAVSIRLTDTGYRLWVHIADVSHYVPWESAIDIEARKRATSVYFPDRVVPMLPRELSENLCSLLPGENRRAFTVQMDFDRFGKRFKNTFYPSIIKSDERMTYTAVAGILAGEDPELMTRYDRFVRDFELMSELASQVRARRLDSGSLDFDLPEPEVLLDIQGSPGAIVKSERNIAHIIIEEFMISANEAVAEYLEDLGAPSIYRIHERPDAVKMEEVLRFAKGLLGIRGGTLQEVLAAARGRPEEEIVNFTVLRSLKQARYSTVNAGHFGLASESYTHFTSPIRRYPDLVVHRILKQALQHGRKKAGANIPPAAPKMKSRKSIEPMESIGELGELLPEIAFGSSRMERNANDAEREVLGAMKVWFMKERLGEEMPVRIIEVTSYGLRVRFEDFYVDSFIHVSLITDDFYVFNEKNLSLTGKHTGKRFSTGDTVMARIERVDMEERQIILGLV